LEYTNVKGLNKFSKIHLQKEGLHLICFFFQFTPGAEVILNAINKNINPVKYGILIL